MRTSRRLLNALMTPALLASASYALAQDKSAKAAPDQWTPQGTDLVTVPKIPQTYKPAKTPWGEPDFRGGWPVDHLNMTPLQRTPAQGTRYFLNDDEFAARQKQIGATETRYDTEQK